MRIKAADNLPPPKGRYDSPLIDGPEAAGSATSVYTATKPGSQPYLPPQGPLFLSFGVNAGQVRSFRA
jgi:hypothetical protein